MSLYIHIPFCRKACHYCNFHFSTTRHQLKAMIDALCSELSLQQEYLKTSLETVYFGGGTPSIIDAADIEKLFETIHKNYSVTSNSEITIETNPDDISQEKLLLWKSFGINRLSIGIQSFYEEDLIWMNRAHNAAQATNCVKLAQDAGFENITIDLIYGTPTLSNEKWLANIQHAIQLKIPHLSCYALTVEEKTALHKLIEKGKIKNIETDSQAFQFEMLMNELEKNNFEHYEISNFAKKDFRSKHNSNYWSGKPYLGIGPSAHSFDGISRQWNISNNALYIKSLASSIVPFEKEILTKENKIDEYIMTSLRTMEGLDLKNKLFTEEGIIENLLSNAYEWLLSGHLIKNKNHLVLTKKGKLFADRIASDLFM